MQQDPYLVLKGSNQFFFRNNHRTLLSSTCYRTRSRPLSHQLEGRALMRLGFACWFLSFLQTTEARFKTFPRRPVFFCENSALSSPKKWDPTSQNPTIRDGTSWQR